MKAGKPYPIPAITGAVPFLACAILPLAGINSLEPFGRLDILATSCGLGIISFLAAAHRATSLYREAGTPLNLFVSSNVLFVAVWLACVLARIKWVLLTQLVALLWLLRAGTLPRHYFGVRAQATARASLSLTVILVSL